MKLKNTSFKYLFSEIKNSSLYCYGIGDFFYRMLENFSEFPWGEKIGGLVDSNDAKYGKVVEVQNKNIKIISLNAFIREKDADSKIIITTKAYHEIVKELNNYKELENVECYTYFHMCNLSNGSVDFYQNDVFKIPPVIHYCWFGGKELPDLYKRCIESWYKFCPDYEIKRWDESNCDIDENLYAKQAYEAKKYGFVPDYFRLKIIYENGGIYLDTDVELLKSLDPLRYDEGFCGLQCPGQVAFGLGFGAKRGNILLKNLLNTYVNMAFINEDGSLNQIASPIYQTKDLIKMGMKKCNHKQYVNGFCVYPTEVLSPINIYVGTIEVTEKSFAIHHFDGSWQDEERRKNKNEDLRKAKEIAELFV